MAEPAWSSVYNFASSPEANGFTRSAASYAVPATVTLTTGGPTAGRKVTLSGADPASGMVFTSTSVPSLDPTVGATAEATVAVAGAGDAGFEVRFLSYAVGLSIFADRIALDLSAATPHVEVPTASNAAATTYRITIDPSGVLRVYRAAVLVGTYQLASNPFPQASIQWWGEGGGTQIFSAFKSYVGGAVPA